jgi:hypothetical protein
MRKFINWLIFLGLVANKVGEALEPVLPAYDSMKEKNKAIDEKNALENPDMSEEQRGVIPFPMK